MVKYSDKYQPLSENVKDIIIDQIGRYKHLFYEDDYSLVQMPNGEVGICTTIRINTGSNSELLEFEPVIISIAGIDIENSNITVYPDRTDFPFDSFPHINYPIGDMQPSVCLTRENFNDWYAEHSFIELLELINDWFRDANKGNLIKTKDRDLFEPFRTQRIDGFLLRRPYEDKYIESMQNHGHYAYSIKIVDFELKIFKTSFIQDEHTENAMGIIFWKPSSQICDKWFAHHPKNYGELVRFMITNGFNLDNGNYKQYFDEQYSNPRYVIFQLAFIRPTIVLGKTNRIDYLTFGFDTEKYSIIGNDTPIDEIAQIDDNTPEALQYLSGTSDTIANKRILILGCGAIGSKLIYHLYRSGISSLTICDNDVMQPHNVCRHALSHPFLFKTKVELLRNELLKMYVSSPPVHIIDQNIIDWLPTQDLSSYDLIIDTTASASVFRLIDKISEKYPSLPFVHFALSDAGNVGLVYMNYDRSSMLSDYYMYIISLSIEDESIQKWIKREGKYNYDRVRIGEGCHSNTMILSDDIVSIHSGIASNIIRNMFIYENNKNCILFSSTESILKGDTTSRLISLPSFESYVPVNNMEWRVRIPKTLIDQLMVKIKVANKKETGGYLMGNIDIKHKTIYVLWTYTPRTISSTYNRLTLPNKDWKEEYKRVRNNSSNIIDYIGDWHSHPGGPLNPSDIDIETNNHIINKELNSGIGVCIIANRSSLKIYLLSN